MYQSPITQIMSDLASQVVREQENQLMYEVRQEIGYDIDKEELIKALRYDRNQYQKGYLDALSELREELKGLIKEEAWEYYDLGRNEGFEISIARIDKLLHKESDND